MIKRIYLDTTKRQAERDKKEGNNGGFLDKKILEANYEIAGIQNTIEMIYDEDIDENVRKDLKSIKNTLILSLGTAKRNLDILEKVKAEVYGN